MTLQLTEYPQPKRTPEQDDYSRKAWRSYFDGLDRYDSFVGFKRARLSLWRVALGMVLLTGVP